MTETFTEIDRKLVKVAVTLDDRGRDLSLRELELLENATRLVLKRIERHQDERYHAAMDAMK